MNRRRPLVVALVLACLPALARAEVSAETAPDGSYLRTVVFTNASLKKVRIWTQVSSRPFLHPLNAEGDLNGDLWPTIAQPVSAPSTPWVVWSRFTGRDFDLAWARWSSETGGWTPVAWVGAPEAGGDDLDPSIAFDAGARPHLAWWRNEGGNGRVYFSMFLRSRWMIPVLVSDEGVDSTSPEITISAQGTIRVQYQTPSGTVVREVRFDKPATITDDTTPFGRVTLYDCPPTISPK